MILQVATGSATVAVTPPSPSRIFKLNLTLKFTALRLFVRQPERMSGDRLPVQPQWLVALAVMQRCRMVVRHGQPRRSRATGRRRARTLRLNRRDVSIRREVPPLSRRLGCASLALALSLPGFPCWRGSWLNGAAVCSRCWAAHSVHWQRRRPLALARALALCVSSSGVCSGCAPVESSAGIGFAACAGKHYFVIGTKAAFLAYPYYVLNSRPRLCWERLLRVTTLLP